MRKEILYFVETVFVFACSWAVWSGLLLLFGRLGVFEFFHSRAEIWRLRPYLSMPYVISLLAGMAAVPLIWEKSVRKISLGDMGFNLPWQLFVESLYAAGLFCIFAGYVLCLDEKSGAVLSLSPHTIFSVSYRLFLIVLAEEIFYRGLIQRRLSNLCGCWRGLIFASVIFALWGHISLPLTDNLILRFPFGMMTGYLYLRSGSLVFPVGVHWFYDIVFGL